MLAYIPSPSTNGLHLGPLNVHLYGAAIAVAVLVAVFIGKKRFVQLGGDENAFDRIAIIAVIGGVAGARLWHVITALDFYTNNPVDIFKVWNGGLAIFGALIGGVLAAFLAARKYQASLLTFVDAVVPALPFAQAIGRLGNYVNQELFGRPTNLPWGVKIDVDNRPIDYITHSVFHPLFLYEALANLIVGFFILFLLKKNKLKRGATLFLYLTLYGLVRFLVEFGRLETHYGFMNATINGYIALGISVCGLIGFIYVQRSNSAVTK